MKKLTTILLSLLLLLALSACTNNNSQIKDDNKEPNNNLGETIQDTQKEDLITKERAIEIALSKAGVTKDAAFDLEAELDREPNGILWEVDFESGQYEYSYDIDAKNGTIISSHKEARD